MSDLEEFLKEKVNDMGLIYVGNISQLKKHYTFKVSINQDTYNRVNFDDSIFKVSKLYSVNSLGCYLILKIKSSYLKHCIDRVTPLN